MRLEPNWPHLLEEHHHDSLNGCRILVDEWSDNTFTAYIEREGITIMDADVIWDKYPSDDELLDYIEER